MVYVPRHAASSRFVTLRGLRCHVRVWGNPQFPVLLLLHGWMDIAASWQFVVDEFIRDWHVIALDLRGFGRSGWSANGYWFPDYYADLDALVGLVSGNGAINLVGHSMGGNIACIYAGVRPGRVRKLVSLEGFGMPAANPHDAPGRIAQWLDQWQVPPTLRLYDSHDELATRLRESNPRLTHDKALFLAAEHAISTADGKIALSSDPLHKAVNPVPYRLEEAMACWRRVTAQTLWMIGRNSELIPRFYGADAAGLAEREACFANLEKTVIDDCGHMLHHDQPRATARAIEAFLA